MKKTELNIIRTIRKEIKRHEQNSAQLAQQGYTAHAMTEVYKKLALEELLETLKQN